MSSFSFRALLLALSVSMFVTACDGTSDLSDITVNVIIEGSGTGVIEAQTIDVSIECIVTDGALSGTCSDAFQRRDAGIIRLSAQPDVVTDFFWDGDCRGIEGRVCDLSFGSGQDRIFDVVGRFEAKTFQVVVTPSPILMTVAGPEGAVVATAQALDEDGAEVFGVSYTWASSSPTHATVTPEPFNRSATIVALQSGSAIVTATAQGLSGQTQVDINLTN